MSSDHDDAAPVPTPRSWPIARQFFSDRGFAISVLPHNDGYTLRILIGDETALVFFDPAGRVTHIRVGPGY
jgi:hypothetical protein